MDGELGKMIVGRGLKTPVDLVSRGWARFEAHLPLVWGNEGNFQRADIEQYQATMWVGMRHEKFEVAISCRSPIGSVVVVLEFDGNAEIRAKSTLRPSWIIYSTAYGYSMVAIVARVEQCALDDEMRAGSVVRRELQRVNMEDEIQAQCFFFVGDGSVFGICCILGFCQVE